jgi:hypothetical protein
MEKFMLSKYNLIFLLIIICGTLLLIRADDNNIDPCFGYDENPVLLADNDLGDHPPMHDSDEMHEFGDKHPDGENFEHQQDSNKRNNNKREEKKITPELETRIIETLKKYFPKLHNRAVTLKKNNPRIYKKLLRKLRKHIRKSKEPREDKKDLISILFEESEIDVMILKYKKSNNEKEKFKLKLQIRNKMSKGFDKREEIQRKVIERIENNITKKKKDHSDRVKNKEKIINEQLEKILK